MIISHKHRFVFIHNPKVGGTSIRKALAPFHDSEQQFWHQGWDRSENRVVDLAHPTYSQLIRVLINEDCDQYSTFGFVRDPYTRFWSALGEFHKRHGEKFRLSSSNLDLIVTPAAIRYDWRFVHFCPQWMFFYAGNGVSRVVDKIGKIENFDADWLSIRKELHLMELPAELPHERRAQERGLDISELSNDPKVIAHINRLYLRDFQIFGYPMLKPEAYPNGLRGKAYDDRIEAIHNPVIAAHYDGTEEQHMTFTPGERTSLEKARESVRNQP